MHSNIITEKVKKDYNEIADEFSQTRRFPWDEFEIFDKFYNRHFSVLDLGCGNGRLLIYLNKKGYASYVGTDQSKELLKHAVKNFPRNKFILHDFSEKMRLAKKFDAIFMVASFHHIPPDLQLSTLKNAKAYLKKGGYIFMSNWNLHQKKFLLPFLNSILVPSYGGRGLLIPWKNRVKRYYYAFTKKKLKNLCMSAGLKLVVNDYYSGREKAGVLRAKNLITIAVNA